MLNEILRSETFNCALVLKRYFPSFNARNLVELIWDYLKADAFIEIYKKNGEILSGDDIPDYESIFCDSNSIKNNVIEYESFFRDLHHSYNGRPAICSTQFFEAYYYLGKLHRENDLPAITTPYTQTFYINGQIHREEDRPAVITRGLTRLEWYFQGAIHRGNNLPAIVDRNYTDQNSKGIMIAWLEKGQYHRPDDGPAFLSSRQMVFYKNGVITRSSGPALFRRYSVHYYEDGKEKSSMRMKKYLQIAPKLDKIYIDSWKSLNHESNLSNFYPCACIKTKIENDVSCEKSISTEK